ncbi:MAG: hypothetical protein AAGJ97_01880 [Planctomycetota bacterium]
MPDDRISPPARPRPGRLRRWLPRITVTGGLLTLAILYPDELPADAETADVADEVAIELVDLDVLSLDSSPLAAPASVTPESVAGVSSPRPEPAVTAPLLPPPVRTAAVETGPVMTASAEDVVASAVVTADAAFDENTDPGVVTVGHETEPSGPQAAWLTGTIEPFVD